MTLFRATAIGETARQILETGGRASVMGVTSRGVFITNAAEQVVFVSFEGWRGPLTINLGRMGELFLSSPFGRGQGEGSSLSPIHAFGEEKSPHPGPLPKGEERKSAAPTLTLHFSRIEHGDPIILESDHILFPRLDICIDAEDLPGWKAEIRRIDALEPPAVERLRTVAQYVVTQAVGKGWTVLLSRWLNPDHPAELPSFLVPIEQSLIHLRQAVHAGNVQELPPLFAQIIGRGSGLTPSGDDVIIGLLLMLSIMPAKDPLLFNTQYAIRNTSSTTRLSTHLMSAAARGQADERLITALNGILTGDLPEIDCAELLLAYGSSSGGDTLLGMTLVV